MSLDGRLPMSTAHVVRQCDVARSVLLPCAGTRLFDLTSASIEHGFATILARWTAGQVGESIPGIFASAYAL
ncbi:hypothetical protein TRAPUB_4853 [Trametes pubescens]|uniref:Uncharacterized protein n=1 Tax=Trametes pubescens TaxID=154538 RepID=A0A1M2VA43_TRAPU|nr:hypothetical protein TRAPUB_4853 [Trametes pubescens]